MSKNRQLGIGLAIGVLLLGSLGYLATSDFQEQKYPGVATLDAGNVDRPVPQARRPMSEEELPLAAVPWSRKVETLVNVEMTEATLPWRTVRADSATFVREAELPKFPTLRDPARPEPVRLILARVPEIKVNK